MGKYFIITLDTEGDNLWAIRNSEYSMSKITNRNGEYLERFQEFCEKYDFKPTYLVNYEMSLSQPFRNMVERHKDNLEIGMHMHAFNSPPYFELPDRYGGNKAYIGEYPAAVQEQKVEYLTKQLEDTFQMPIKSHRGGRWYIDPGYIAILKKNGYLVDCTVTPGIDWTGNYGQTEGSHGVDFRKAPTKAYRMSGKNVCQKGTSGIIEIPMSLIRKDVSFKKQIMGMDLWGRKGNHENYIWLRPTGTNLNGMKRLVEEKAKTNDYLEFMIHSSELMPGGSPIFKNNEFIDKLYDDIGELFECVSKTKYKGTTLSEYAENRIKKYNGGKKWKPN